jgi:hypothetical protein
MYVLRKIDDGGAQHCCAINKGHGVKLQQNDNTAKQSPAVFSVNVWEAVPVHGAHYGF